MEALAGESIRKRLRWHQPRQGEDRLFEFAPLAEAQRLHFLQERPNFRGVPLGFVVPVRGESRQTFDRYGKPAALFRLDPSRESQPFLLRLDGLGKSEPDDSSD